MSAGQHEATQVPAPGDFVEQEDLGGDGDPVEGTSESSRSSLWEMLTSTSPSESPDMQDGTLSTDAEWYQHAELAIKKATGASGTPAWVNFVMSGLLLAARSAGMELPSSSSDGKSRAPNSESSSTSRDDQPGEVVGTAENGDTSIVA